MSEVPNSMRPRFDFTVNLGHVMTFGAMLVTLIIGYANFNIRLEAVEKQLETSNANFIQLITQGSDLRHLTQRMERVEKLLEPQ